MLAMTPNNINTLHAGNNLYEFVVCQLFTKLTHLSQRNIHPLAIGPVHFCLRDVGWYFSVLFKF